MILADVAKAAHEVVEQAKDAGVWVFGGGVKGHEASVVATDGSGAMLETCGCAREGRTVPSVV